MPSGEKLGAKFIVRALSQRPLSPDCSTDRAMRCLRPSAGEADIGDPAARRATAAASATVVSPAVTIAVVDAVAVHHRDALDPVRAGAAFGDISDQRCRRCRLRR